MPTIPEIVAVLSYGNTDLIKKANDKEGTCYCPVHEKGGASAGHKTPSLGLFPGTKTPILWKCRSQNCDPIAIKKAMQEEGIVFESPIRQLRKKALLKSSECDVWIHPITSEMIDHRPSSGYIKKEQRKISYLYQYTDDEGKVVFFRARFEFSVNGVYEKQLRPLGFYSTKDGEKSGWAWKEPPATPFYYEHLLTSKPTSRVMIVEGEKTADAAQKIYMDFAVISICNERKTKLKKLKGRDVVLFPDNDKPGKDKAIKLAHTLAPICKTVHIVPVWEHKLPRAWDLADPLPAGVKHIDFLKNLLIPEQLKISTILEKCALVRMKSYDDKEKMNEDLRTLCSDHLTSQKGSHKWPSPKNTCEYCKCRESIDRPLDLLSTPEIITNWVFVAEENSFHNVYKNSTIGPDAFCNYYAGEYSRTNEMPVAKVFYTEHPQARRVERKGYMPGRGIVYDEDGQSILNTWKLPTAQAVRSKDEKIKPFFDLLGMLFNNTQERSAILDWMTFIIQNPGKTVNWAPILSGPPGCGKDSFFRALICILGETNCTEVSEIELDTDFWDFGTKQLAIFQETSRHGRWGLYNRLKPFLTNNKVMVHEKRVQAHYVPRVTNYAMVTNSDHPIPLDEGDRRWFFVECNMTVRKVASLNEKDPKFWDRYHAMCEDPEAINGLLSMFMMRGLEGFNPKGHAPDTPAKIRLIKESKSLNEQLIDELLATRSWPFYTGIFSLSQITSCVKEQDIKANEKKISKLLRGDPRFEPLGRARRIRMVDGKRIHHFQIIFRLTKTALRDVESQEDIRELKKLFLRIDADIMPNLKGEGSDQAFLYQKCFDEGWLNYDMTYDKQFTKEIALPKFSLIKEEKKLPL